MSRRFYQDSAGRVLERATGEVLGSVVCVGLSPHDAIYFPRDANGDPIEHRGRYATLVHDLAVLTVARAARPGEALTVWDVRHRRGPR